MANIVDAQTYDELERLYWDIVNEEGGFANPALNDITQLQGEIVLADLRQNVEEKCLTG